MIAVPVVYSEEVCQYLWKFGDYTARIPLYPAWSITPGPEPALLPPGTVVDALPLLVVV